MLKDRLAELRKKKGYSQAQMANFLNITRQAYNHYETGTRVPPSDSLKILADVLDASADYLLNRTDTIASDSKDIAEELERIQQMLENQEHLMFDGSPMSQDAKSYILSAMRIGMAAAKQKKQDADEKKDSKEVRK